MVTWWIRFLNGGERMTGAHEAGAALPPAAALDEDKGEETWWRMARKKLKKLSSSSIPFVGLLRRHLRVHYPNSMAVVEVVASR
jgi:hypothetical protein